MRWVLEDDMSESNEIPEIVPATKGERLAEFIAIVTSAAPWIGGPVAEIIGGVATNLKIKRVTQFVKEVLDRVENLHTKASEDFVKTEDFADIFEKTAQAVADERDETKRRLFSNYILSNIAAPSISYNHRLKCLRLLIEVDTRHIDLIKALLQSPTAEESDKMMSTPSTTLEERAPHLRGDLSALIHETNTLGLTNIRTDYMNTMMTGGGAANLAGNVTQLGKDLMAFILGKE